MLVYIKEREVEVPVRTVINGFIGRKIKIAFMQRALLHTIGRTTLMIMVSLLTNTIS